MMDSGDLLVEADARQAFLNFVELLAHSHPLTRFVQMCVYRKVRSMHASAAISQPTPFFGVDSYLEAGTAVQLTDETVSP